MQRTVLQLRRRLRYTDSDGQKLTKKLPTNSLTNF